MNLAAEVVRTSTNACNRQGFLPVGAEFPSSKDAPGETGIGTYSRTVIKFICKSKIASQSSYARVTSRVRLCHKVHMQE